MRARTVAHARLATGAVGRRAGARHSPVDPHAMGHGGVQASRDRDARGEEQDAAVDGKCVGDGVQQGVRDQRTHDEPCRACLVLAGLEQGEAPEPERDAARRAEREEDGRGDRRAQAGGVRVAARQTAQRERRHDDDERAHCLRADAGPRARAVPSLGPRAQQQSGSGRQGLGGRLHEKQAGQP